MNYAPSSQQYIKNKSGKRKVKESTDDKVLNGQHAK